MEVAQLYTTFNRSLLTYIRGKINSREDAEDILHDVFIKIANKEASLRGKDNVKNWMFIVTRNAIIDYYRKQGNKKNDPLQDHFPEDEQEKDVTQGLDECLAKFIALLPDNYRDILFDAEIKGIKQKQLAVKYNLPYPSLRSRVQRGREKLKQLLSDCCLIEADRRGNILEVIPRKKQQPRADNCKSCND